MNLFPQYCKSQGLPEPVAEHRFHEVRKWRFDWAWIDAKVALEVEGGVWSGGSHGRGTGITRDIEKGNAAAVRGWIVLRCQPRELMKLDTINMIRQAIATRKKAAEEAEAAKPIGFGTRVKVAGREEEVWKVACDEPSDEGYWRLAPRKCGNLNTMTAKRHEFTVID